MSKPSAAKKKKKEGGGGGGESDEESELIQQNSSEDEADDDGDLVSVSSSPPMKPVITDRSEDRGSRVRIRGGGSSLSVPPGSCLKPGFWLEILFCL